MFLAEIRKNNVYPCKPQFYYIKVGFKVVNIIQACFRDEALDAILEANYIFFFFFFFFFFFVHIFILLIYACNTYT